MNNIYAKTVHKECSTPHKLRPITSARGFKGVRKAPKRGPGRSLESFSLIRTFCSSTVGVDKIAGVWGQSPQSLAIFKNKIVYFKQYFD